MATRAHDISSLILPVRVRSAQAQDANIPVKLALADRIAELPGIEVFDDPDPGSRSVRVLFRPPAESLRKEHEPLPLCRIGTDGMVVFGLSDRDRYRVLSCGWGRLYQNSVMLFLPRDDDDLEIAWRIVRRAYDALVDASASTADMRPARTGELPNFSRINLQ